MTVASPKTVLITGAGGGMCKGINRRIAEAGHTVVAVDLHPEAAELAAAEIRSVGGTAVSFAADVSNADAVRELEREVTSAVGAVDVLVNAAGILDRKRLADHDDDSFERSLAINLTGPFRMVQAFSPAMIERGWGRIINISSIAGTTGYPYPSYAASKAGLSNLTRSLVMDFWGTGITVNAICPGIVDTPMVIDEVRTQVPRKVPTTQIVDPEEIGGLATFLISEDARNINGTNIVIDGGATQFFALFDRE